MTSSTVRETESTTPVLFLLFLNFFSQEKMKSKNKLVPRLLGITKESVMRVDERTKDVVQEWPLTTVKRWAASPKSFTLVRRIADASVWIDLFLFPQQFTGALSRFVPCELSFKRRIRMKAPLPCSHEHSLCCGGGRRPFIPSRTSLTEQLSFVFPLSDSALCPHPRVNKQRGFNLADLAEALVLLNYRSLAPLVQSAVCSEHPEV